MEIKEMDLEQVETRLAEVKDMLHEDGADLEALETEIRSLKGRKAEINAEIEARKAEVKEVMETAKEVRTFEEERTFKKMDEKEVRNSKEYIDAYAEYIKGNKNVRELTMRLNTINAEDGTVAVPDLVYDVVRTAWDRNEIMARVRKSYLKGNLQVGFEISATGAVIHTEGTQPIDSENLVLGIAKLVPQSIKKWIAISDEVYDMRGEEFLRYIYDELTYQIALKASQTLVGAILTSPATSQEFAPAVPELEKNVAVDTIASALALLTDEATNPVIIMNKQTWAEFKRVQYANGYGVDVFEGLPVLFCNILPAYATATAGNAYAIVGDLENGALANFPNGEEITLKFDDKSMAEADLIKIIGRQYVGLGVVAPNHFVKVKKTSGGQA